jgi:hypothetical protein
VLTSFPRLLPASWVVCRQVLRHVIAPKQDWVAHYDDDADAPDMEGGPGPARSGPAKEASRRALRFQP